MKVKQIWRKDNLPDQIKFGTDNFTKNVRGQQIFCHYISLETCKKILNSKSIFISRIVDMNDTYEASQANDNLFALCFCQSDTDKIPMWYLYSGISGKGVKLRFTKSQFFNWLNKSTIYSVDETGKQSGQPIPKESYEMVGARIVYKDDLHLKYFNQYYVFGEDKDVAEKKLDDSFFTKPYPWEYEMEFRVLITVNKKEFGKTIPKRLAIGISPSQYPFDIVLGPETNTQDELDFYRSDEFIKYYQEKMGELAKSQLKVKMDIFKRNICSVCGNSKGCKACYEFTNDCALKQALVGQQNNNLHS